MKLVLFDIDGTLLRSNGAGSAAMRYALETTFGTAGAIDSHQFGGSCDRHTVFTLMREIGFDDATIETKFNSLEIQMVKHLKQQPHLDALLGGHDVYKAIHYHEGTVLGLLTGNFEASARVKLQLAGYEDNHVVVGAYGSESMERADLPLFAIERANQIMDHVFTPQDVVIIGDTTHDIACAHINGARALAVATGSHTVDILKAAKPDLLLDDLSDLQTILDFILT